MEVAVHHTCYLGHVGDDGEDFLQIKLMQSHSKVLQGLFVLVVGIDLHTHAICREQFQVGRHALVASQVEVVVIVDGKLAVTQYGVVGEQVHLDAVLLHISLGTQFQSKAVLFVIKSHLHSRPSLQQIAVEQGVEGVLRIVLGIAHLHMIVALGRV